MLSKDGFHEGGEGMKQLSRALGLITLSAIGAMIMLSAAVMAQEQSDYAVGKIL